MQSCSIRSHKCNLGSGLLSLGHVKSQTGKR